MHNGLYCHRHRGAVSTLCCVSKGGAGVQGITAAKMTSKKQIKAEILILSSLEMKLAPDLLLVCMTLLSIIFHLIFHTEQKFDVMEKLSLRGSLDALIVLMH